MRVRNEFRNERYMNFHKDVDCSDGTFYKVYKICRPTPQFHQFMVLMALPTLIQIRWGHLLIHMKANCFDVAIPPAQHNGAREVEVYFRNFVPAQSSSLYPTIAKRCVVLLNISRIKMLLVRI